ncbi:MAG: PAS domain S-box protein [Agarilytica sp.]
MANQPPISTHRFGGVHKKVQRNVLLMNVCLALVVVGQAMWALNSIQARVQEEYKNTMQTVMATTQEGIALWHEQQSQSIEIIASRPEFRKVVKAQLALYRQHKDIKKSNALSVLREQIPLFSGLTSGLGFFVIAPDGVSIASMRDANIGTVNLVKEQRSELFERAVRGETLMVPPLQSDVPIDGDGNIAGKAVPATMFFLTPIRGANSGEVIAVLAARKSPARAFSDIAKLGRLGASGETYLFNRDGQLITASRFYEDLEKIGFIERGESSILSVSLRAPEGNLLDTHRLPDDTHSYPLTLMAASAIQGNKGSNVEGYLDYRGVKVIGTWLWIDELDIGIATEIDFDEAMETYRTAQGALIIVLGGVLVAAIMLSTLTLRMGTRATKLLETAKEGLEGEVTARTQELEYTKNHLQLVVDNVPAVVFLKDANGKYLLVNKKYTELTGITVEEAIGNSDHDIFPPEIAEKFVEADSAVLLSGVSQDLEEKAPSPDGALHDYWSSKIPLKDSEGNIHALLGIALDITERKRSERMLQETKDFLSYSEARWRAILDNLGDAVITIDQQGRIQTFSRAATEIFGYSAEEAIGKNVNILMPEEIATVHDGFLNRDLKEGESVLLNNRRDLHALRKSGEKFPVEISITTLSFQGEKIFVGVLRDVTKGRKMEVDLVQSKEAAEKASKAKSEFLAAMSHEIRTPMNGVLGMLGLLGKTELTQAQNRKLDIAQSSAQALLTLINDILDFSKVEAGKMELEEVDFNLRSQIDSVCQSLAHKVHEKGLEFNLDLTDVKQSNVCGDPSRLRQILINLVGNAVKFTGDGEVLVKAKLTEVGKEAYRLSCSVKDTGIGIPKDKVGKLFSSFSQVDSSVTRKYGGTGLGLAICKKLCELMGGGILVESEEGKGSEFKFNVRLGRASSSELVMPRSHVTGLHVLIVDDNKTNREIFNDQLKQWDCIVEEADSANAALALCQAKTNDEMYDLILTDMAMPEKTGLDLARQLRRNARFSDVKLLMMSSIGLDLEELKALGFSAYFSKPVTTSDLFDALSICATPENGEGGLLTKTKLNALEGTSNALNIRHIWPEGTRILLVEDNQVNQYVAQELLQEVGLTCDVAANGLEAIESLASADQSDVFTLVLMDCQMPELDGYEATRRIRAGVAGDHAKETPIVAMTANVMQGDKEKCYAAGMNAYLAKPLDAHEFFATLKAWLGGEDVEDAEAAGNAANVVSGSEQGQVINIERKEEAESVNAETEAETSGSLASVSEEGLSLPQGLQTIDFAKKKPSIARKPAAYLKLLKLYLDNNENFCVQLSKAQAQEDEGRIRHLVHSLKGSAGNMGMQTVFNHAIDVEKMFDEGGVDTEKALKRFKELVELSFLDASAIMKANKNE